MVDPVRVAAVMEFSACFFFFFFVFSVDVRLFLKRRGRSMVTLEVGLLGVWGYGQVSELVACEREHCGLVELGRGVDELRGCG